MFLGAVHSIAMVDVSSLAPDAMNADEAAETDHRYRFLGYGNPGTGKTHFGYTMPDPVMIIDTEGKADAISQKFDSEHFVWQPSNYDEAVDALDQALDVGDKFLREEDQRGTIVVDSFSLIWDWSQQKYMEMAYPGREQNEVNFSSALQAGGESDWQSIKRYHNERFRERMLDSDLHLYWTAMSAEDYGAIIEGNDDPPAKPVGEKNNQYKCSELLHFYEGEDGKPHANLKKTALTKWRFGGMQWPDFNKASGVIETVSQAESNPEPIKMGDLLTELRRDHDADVSLHEGDPDMVYKRGEDGG